MSSLRTLIILFLLCTLSFCLTEVQLQKLLEPRLPKIIKYNDVIKVKQIGSVAGEPLYTQIGHRLPPGERIIVSQKTRPLRFPIRTIA